jgi:hypothetical protein
VPAEEVSELQRLLGIANDVARRHESEAQRLAAEVHYHEAALVCVPVDGLTIILIKSGHCLRLTSAGSVLFVQVLQLQEELLMANAAAPALRGRSNHAADGQGLAVESLRQQNDRVRAQYRNTLQALSTRFLHAWTRLARLLMQLQGDNSAVQGCR